jgi:hypothetical protein
MSERDDDLSQWRAYGGGEGGISIGFDPRRVLESCAAAGGRGLFPVLHKQHEHGLLVDQIFNGTVAFYRRGLERRPGISSEQWRSAFLAAWRGMIIPFAAFMKHDAFESEHEWRIVKWYGSTDLPSLRFRQRQTLLSRHLPLSLCSPDQKPARLPIKSVIVGPSRHKAVTLVSVGTLLQQQGYDLNTIELKESRVPFKPSEPRGGLGSRSLRQRRVGARKTRSGGVDDGGPCRVTTSARAAGSR